MQKIIFYFSIISFISIQSQENLEKPTYEQIINSPEVSIRIKANIRDDNYDKQLWKEITLEVNDLINKCYASNDNEFTTEQIFAEIYKTIDSMRQKTHADNGIYGLVEIHVGQPDTNKNDPNENA